MFRPRLSEYSPTPMQGNKWWYTRNNIYYPNFGLPNCTCYCYGRISEIINKWNHHLPGMDAKKWYDDLVSSGLYQYGHEPKLGGIMCYAPEVIDPDDPDDPSITEGGHVAIVEEVFKDPDTGEVLNCVTSNSAWEGTYFWTERVYILHDFLASWMYPPSRHYYYQGCIYATPDIVVGNERKGMPIYMMIKMKR